MRLLVSIWALVTFAFLILHLVPGDPVRMALGQEASADLVTATRHGLGLDLPLVVQYGRYLAALLRGDLGTSLASQLSVGQTIGHLLPNTVMLAVIAFVLVMVVAVPLGLVMAIATQHGRRRGAELAYTSTAVVISAIPEFLLAVGLVYVFAVSTHLLPVAGKGGPSTFVLPVIALALGPIMTISRIVRVEVLSALDQDFVRTARAKRLRPARIYLRHVLPNAFTATLTLSGLLLSGLVAGTVLVETIFAWPGLGPTLVSSILGHDYPMVQAIVLVYGGQVLLVNFVVDILLAVIDPRSTILET